MSKCPSQDWERFEKQMSEAYAEDERVTAIVQENGRLRAALHRIASECDGEDMPAIFDPRAACKQAVKTARKALAKVGHDL